MLKRIWKLISMTFTIWGTSNASRMAAALAYFAMLSLAPCLMIAIAIAGYIYDDTVAADEIVKQVETITTPGIAQTIDGLISQASRPRSGIVAGTISLCVMVFAASGVFTQLYDTFNDIWDISFEGINGILFTIRKRLLGVAMVLLIGVLLIAALVLDSTLAYINTLVEGYPRLEYWLSLADRSLSFLLMPLVFSMMFWFFPATKIHWNDVWPAGILTACLIAASRYLIGIYMKFSTTSEVYGAMGSLAVLLIWIYMTGLVVFFGASFSHAWSETFGSRSDFGSRPKDLSSDEPATKPEPTQNLLTPERRPTKTT
jgi:membrane protein